MPVRRKWPLLRSSRRAPAVRCAASMMVLVFPGHTGLSVIIWKGRSSVFSKSWKAAKALKPGSIRDMAKNYADRLQAIYPPGPYNLLGWSFGGFVAHEVAIELHRRGCVVQRLVLVESRVQRYRLDRTQSIFRRESGPGRHLTDEWCRYSAEVGASYVLGSGGFSFSATRCDRFCTSFRTAIAIYCAMC